MSELLRNACAEAREGNANIKQVRDIGNKFLNSVEISAQEAVYINSSTSDAEVLKKCYISQHISPRRTS